MANSFRSCRALVIALVGTMSLVVGCRSTHRLSGPPPVVELRLADFEPTEGYQKRVSRQGETIYIAPESVIVLHDVREGLLRKQGDDDFLLLNIRSGARLRLDAATLQHLERPVAFMIDDDVAYVPILRTSISRQVPVRVGARGITMEEAKRIVDAVLDQRDFGVAPRAPPGPPAPAPAPTSAPTPADGSATSDAVPQ